MPERGPGTPTADDIRSTAFTFSAATSVFAVLYAAAGYRVSFSIPRGETGFLVETALYGAAGAAAALAVGRRAGFSRLAEETRAATLLFGLPYLLAAGWVGLDPAYLAGPRMSFGVALLATLGFYVSGPLGALLLARTRPRR